MTATQIAAKDQAFWSHPSLRTLTAEGDPVQAVTARARALVLSATDEGWTGPPFDPFGLAAFCKIAVVPRNDIPDARTVPLEAGGLQIEFNPNRTSGRIVFSVAHEIAHTLFPDCHKRVRNREMREHMRGDDWQLEMLCNVAAAELLMPVGSFPELKEESLSIQHLMELRKKYAVSSEALLMRAVKLSSCPCAMFAASRVEAGTNDGRYQLDYMVGSGTWEFHVASGSLLPAQTVLQECTAIGFTAAGRETWHDIPSPLKVECVGVPPYPTRLYPRVVGIVTLIDGRKSESPSIKYLVGDATQPRGSGNNVIAHVVNDRAARWGAGFGLVVRKRWPQVQADFLSWAEAHRSHFQLGQIRITPADDDLLTCQLICQSGYGASRSSRLRYNALQECLDRLRMEAVERHLSVHMPRIGTGQAGGRWEIIEEMIEDALVRKGVEVTVYDLPSTNQGLAVKQGSLFSS